MFSDDIVLLSPIFDANDCIRLQNDLLMVSEFFDKNCLKLNPSKSEYMRIGLKDSELFKYQLNGIPVRNVLYHKQIGVSYEKNMTFDIHVNEIVAKALKKFGFCKFICKRVDPKTFLRVYKTYILPIIEYSNLCLVYNKTQLDRIEKIQKRITKYICLKSGFDMSYEQRLKFLEIESLEKRRNRQILKLLYKIRISCRNIPQKWLGEISFYESSRNGIYAKISVNRLHKSDKYLIDFSVKFYNNFPNYN